MRKPEGEEARTRRVQLTQKQSLVDLAKKKAADENISTNEWLNEAIQAYISLNLDNKAEQHTRRVQLLLTPTTYDDLAGLAERNGRSVNQTVENAILAYSTGPIYYDQAKFFNAKNHAIMDELNFEYGGLSNQWERVQALREKMEKSPKSKRADIQKEIDSMVDSIWKGVDHMQKEMNEIDLNYGKS